MNKSLIDIMIEKSIYWPNKIGTDKEFNHRYCSLFYDSEFINYRHKQIDLLEIGVQSAASMILFSEYFINANSIVGIDINPVPANNYCNYNKIKTIIADAYSIDIVNTLSQFDIIIDDGPHTKLSHISCLQLYTALLKPRGILIIEDIPNLEWTEEYKQLVPHNMTSYIVDCRIKSNMSDSILFIVKNN